MSQSVCHHLQMFGVYEDTWMNTSEDGVFVQPGNQTRVLRTIILELQLRQLERVFRSDRRELTATSSGCSELMCDDKSSLVLKLVPQFRQDGGVG